MAKKQLNPRTTNFEFGGPIGATVLTVFLPIFTILINLQLTPSKIHSVTYYLNFCKSSHLWISYCLWFSLLAAGDLLLPGKTLNGVKLRDGKTLKYKINGISNSVLLLLILALRWKLTDGEMPELQYLYENHLHLAIISIIFSVYLSCFVYLKSFINNTLLALGGNSGNVIYDWFIGRELNPRIGSSFDIKLFCELRPGMLLWFLINLSCLHHYYVTHNRELNDSLVLINLLQALYIFDGVLNEEGLLTMIDITTDGFGFMLAFGDLTFVPFTYALQARFLSVSPIHLGKYRTSLILSLMSLGYWIFHSSNREKSQFKKGKLPHLKAIQTKRGTKLLCDSWWSVSQHINYFGDWLISLSWCLTTWFQTPLTYYYSVYFAVLLFHRQKRDEKKCSEKYGNDWIKYQERVPYKIIPYVY
ncbi:hypothetical protein KAFR_0A08190 [Kazachstania africana CBS 2517]|uniref:Delta(14)-sterol reductase n=1 Tax=Kazachstania africana (strain ATCC 22294 / BCRC 22015 / CBS 2517 / CECT 1963 / NBRC 1671 / NRRL Y-8276) TaxID=1071382 RepID=H2APF3_KAZAF|nr:hypothetical protein KAFR_0A08190 [Kazachstania africana CBS 2517]CCF56253.1 hypothetical protein KAFR_0A08190 [Kazachstania africana CBS 2517]